MDNLTDYFFSKQVFNSIMVMGETGAGKSNQIALMCKWLFNQFGYKALLVLADQGSGPAPYLDLNLVEDCGMKFFSLHDTDEPVNFLAKISQGYWPVYEESEDGIKTIVRANSQYKIDFNEYQIMIFDSLTGLSEYLGEYYSSPKNNIGFKLGTIAKDGDYEYGTMQQGHYQLAQKQLRQAFSVYVPRLPLKFLFVASQIEETKRGYVPATIGSALNHKTGGWFRNSFHIASEVVPISVLRKQKVDESLGIAKEADNGDLVETRVAWYKEHKNNLTGIPYMIKARIPLPLTNLVEARYPEGYQVLDTEIGLARFFDYLTKANEILKRKRES